MSRFTMSCIRSTAQAAGGLRTSSAEPRMPSSSAPNAAKRSVRRAGPVAAAARAIARSAATPLALSSAPGWTIPTRAGASERDHVHSGPEERGGGRARRDDPGARGDLAAPGRQVVVAPVRPHVAHSEDRRGAVLARVDRLGPPFAVVIGARRAEGRGGVPLARKVLRDEHDLPLHVEPRVVVVTEFRRGDPVPGPDELAVHGAVVAEAEGEPAGSERGGRFPDGERVPLAEGRAEGRIELLEEPVREGGREPGLPEPVRDPGGRLRTSRGADAAAGAGGVREPLDLRPRAGGIEPLPLDAREGARGEPRTAGRGEQEDEGEARAHGGGHARPS